MQTNSCFCTLFGVKTKVFLFFILLKYDKYITSENVVLPNFQAICGANQRKLESKSKQDFELGCTTILT